jgi:hypothetical protein
MISGSTLLACGGAARHGTARQPKCGDGDGDGDVVTVAGRPRAAGAMGCCKDMFTYQV